MKKKYDIDNFLKKLEKLNKKIKKRSIIINEFTKTVSTINSQADDIDKVRINNNILYNGTNRLVSLLRNDKLKSIINELIDSYNLIIENKEVIVIEQNKELTEIEQNKEMTGIAKNKIEEKKQHEYDESYYNMMKLMKDIPVKENIKVIETKNKREVAVYDEGLYDDD